MICFQNIEHCKIKSIKETINEFVKLNNIKFQFFHFSEYLYIYSFDSCALDKFKNYLERHGIKCEYKDDWLLILDKEDDDIVIKVNYSEFNESLKDRFRYYLLKKRDDFYYEVNYEMHANFMKVITVNKQTAKEIENVIEEFAEKNNFSIIMTTYLNPKENDNVNYEMFLYHDGSECETEITEVETDNGSIMITDEFIDKITDKVLERIKSKL